MKKVLIFVLLSGINFFTGNNIHAGNPDAELVIQKGHTDNIASLDISYDEKYLVSGSIDNTFIVWDIGTGKQLKKYGKKGNYLRAPGIAAFHPSALKVAYTVGNNHVYYKDITSNKQQATHFSIPEHAFIKDIKLSGRHDQLIVASEEGKLYCFSLSKPSKEPLIFNKHKAVINTLALSNNEKYLASADKKGHIYVWNLKDQKRIEKIRTRQGSIYTLKFDPDSKKLISAGQSGNIQIFSIPAGKQTGTIEKHQGLIRDMEVFKDTLVSYSEDGMMFFHDLRHESFLYKIQNHEQNIHALSISPHQSMLFMAGQNGMIRALDYRNKEITKDFGGFAHPVKALQLSKDNFRLLSGWQNGMLQLWELRNLKTSTVIHPHRDAVYDVALGRDNMVFSSAKDGMIQQFDTKKEMHLHAYKTTAKANYPIVKGNDSLLISSLGNQIGLYDTDQKILIRKISLHNARITALAYYPEKNIIASGSAKNEIVLYDLKKNKKLGTLKGHGGAVYALQFSPDGKYLASGSYDKLVKLWHVGKKSEIKTFAGHGFAVWDLKFTANSKYMLSAAGDGNIMMWDVISGHMTKKFKGHKHSVESIALSREEDFLVSCSLDGSIRFWDMKTSRELARMIPLSDNDYAVVTPDGLFDASAGAMKKIHFTKGLEIIELEQLKDKFYEPGLLPKVLGYSNEPLEKTGKSIDKMALHPEFDIIPPGKNNEKLGILLKNRGGGIGKVRIFINNKEVNTDVRGNAFNASKEKARLEYHLSNHPYLIDSSLNKISVEVYDKEGYVSSGRKNVFYFKEGTKAEKPEFYGLFCGVSDYKGSELDLKFAAKDASDIANVMQMVAQKQFGKQNVHIHTLTTEANTPQPHKNNIKKAFHKIADEAKAHDVFMVYLSGHGITFGGREGDFYYLTADADSPELNDPEYRNAAAVSGKEFTKWIKGMPALKQVMVLDACNSGKITENLLAMRGMTTGQIRSLERLKDRTGLYILAGSAADAVSYETSIYGQGLLTHSLLFGIKGAALRNDKYVDVMNLFQFAADKVPELAGNIGGIQKPEVRVPYGGESFDIGMVTDSLQNAIELASPKPLFTKTHITNEKTWNDELDLSAAVNQKLNNLSKKGKDSPLIYVNTDNFHQAYKIKGRYTYHNKPDGDGHVIDLKVRIFNQQQVIDTFTLKGIDQHKLVSGLVSNAIRTTMHND